MTTYHLAQLNVAEIRHPLESSEMAGFVEALEPVNALAEEAPGFVWRLQTEEGDATAIRVFGSDMILVNLSVWETIDALRDFVYRGDHVEIMRRRAEWFHRASEAYIALWWVPAGTLPTAEEAKERLELLRTHGPTAEAFTFRTLFPAPSAG